MNDCKYLIKILPAEGCNPEFAPDAKAQEGYEMSGFILMGFNEEAELQLGVMQNLSAHIIAEAIRDNSNEDVVNVLRQASAVAEGQIRAMEIFRAARREKQNNDLIEKLSAMFPGGEDDDEAGE